MCCTARLASRSSRRVWLVVVFVGVPLVEVVVVAAASGELRKIPFVGTPRDVGVTRMKPDAFSACK